MNNAETLKARDVLLEVNNLKAYFPITSGVIKKTVGHVKAVDDISFTVYRTETLGLVGESGCGKTTTGHCLLNLIKPTGGKVLFNGEDLGALDEREMRFRRRDMQLIFQDPYASLNPRMTIFETIAEPLIVHRLVPRKMLKESVHELMTMVELDPSYAERYPHEFSGGQRQRIVIARALAVRPAFIVCDEPVSALDVSIQAQVIRLLVNLKREFGLTYLFISHDLAVVKSICDRVIVMYLGMIMESGACSVVFKAPLHPYTQSLFSAIPVPDPAAERLRTRILLTGDVPSPSNKPTGCPFHPRCFKAIALCREVVPELKEYGAGHWAACHLAEKV